MASTSNSTFLSTASSPTKPAIAILKYISLALVTWLIYYASTWYTGYHRNLAAAKRSGIHYIIVPIYFLNRFWLITNPLWIKLFRKFPDKYTGWVDYCLPEFSWDYRHEIFERTGHDTFLTCAPGGLTLWTAEPAVITQITTRRNDFPKMTELYKSVDIYGKSVVSTEGNVWRHHRKATSPPFTEKNNHLVWIESIDQAQAMLQSWVGKDGKGNKTIERIMDDTMRLSLHVISRAGFGRKLQWPTEASEAKIDTQYIDNSKIQNVSDETDPGHSMSYTYALHCLLDNILFQFVMPRWMLAKLPFTITKKAYEAFNEWGDYMREAVDVAKKQSSKQDDSMDILAQLVKGQRGGDAKSSNQLTDSEILGNMFVLILAGHETAANSLHFSMLYLALYLPSQRRLQRDLDQIFQGRPPSQWDYDRDLPTLFGGMTGAVLAEELRLVPPVVNIPKSTVKVQTDQPLVVNGKKCIVPIESYIALCSVAVQRNPAYWPPGTPLYPGGHPVHPAANLDNDLEEFKPERWLVNDPNGHANGNSNGVAADEKGGGLQDTMDNEGIGVNLSADTSDRLFKPVKGSYIPFSDGYRACLGRRFAQVEVLATLAVIFQNYSVELAVDDYASDAEIDDMNEEEKAQVWQLAAENARDLMLNGCGVVITLQMRKGSVKLRFVQRGKERFADDVDDLGRRERLQKDGKTGKPGDWKRDPDWRAWQQPK